MTALPHSKSNKDKDLHVALWNKCTIETECQLHYNMNWFTYDTLYREGPSLCIYDSGTHSNRVSRCENHVCTTYYRHVRFTPSSRVPSTLLYPGRLTTWCLTQQKNSANKGLLARSEGTLYNIARVSWLHMIQTLTVPDASKANRGSPVQVWQCTGASSQCWPVPQYHHQCSVVRTKCEWSEQQLDDLCCCHLDFCCLTKYPDNRDSKVLLAELTS